MRFCCGLLVATVAACSALRLRTGSTNSGEEGVYDFSDSSQWHKASFEDKWAMFRDAVPVAKLQANYDIELDKGPVCHPTLVGPEDSDKLAILLHGFLACPGLWFRIVPRLVANGFRVMLPTLPGHGRAWRLPKFDKGTLTNTIVDLGEGPITNGSDIGFDLSDAADDIDDIPRDAKPYEIFAATLGELAIQFKKEHPDGIVAVAGHSLGGAITARYAMDIPEVVDRVMLLNPMFGLAKGWIETITSLTPNMRLSKGSTCEHERGKGSGGTCQFRLAHVGAMVEFGYSTLCKHWGILPGSDCRVMTDPILGRMKEIQVVTTRGESSVDNSRISKFANAVQKERMALHGVRVHFNHNALLCQWPSDLGHAYLSNRKTASSSEKWWHPYVEHVSAEFLTTGRNVDIVKVGSINDCLSSSANVESEYLNLLPAVQHSQFYNIGKRAGFERADIVFSGDLSKESHTWGHMNGRHIEIVVYNHHYLIVTRLHRNANVRDIYVIRENSLVGFTKESNKFCVQPELDDVAVDIPLAEAVTTARSFETLKFSGSGLKPRILKLCGNNFVKSVCNMLHCKSAADATIGGLGLDVMEEATEYTDSRVATLFEIDEAAVS